MGDDSYEKFQEQIFDKLRDMEQLKTEAETYAVWEQVVQKWADAGFSAEQIIRFLKLNAKHSKLSDPIRSKILGIIRSKLP